MALSIDDKIHPGAKEQNMPLLVNAHRRVDVKWYAQCEVSYTPIGVFFINHFMSYAFPRDSNLSCSAISSPSQPSRGDSRLGIYIKIMKKRSASFCLEEGVAQKMRFESDIYQVPSSWIVGQFAMITTTPTEGDIRVTESSTGECYTCDAMTETTQEDMKPKGKVTGEITWGGGKWIGFAAKPHQTAQNCDNHSSRNVADSLTCKKGAQPKKEDQAQGRTLRQLKIDAMFSSASPKCSSAKLADQSMGEAASESVGLKGMDVDTSTPTCYVCRGAFGVEGGDVLCSFCDRSVCNDCSQHCFACGIKHCSLCLAADFSSEFESYFCPPCYQDRRHQGCNVGVTELAA